MISYINFDNLRRSFEILRSRRLVTVRERLSDDKSYIRYSRCGLDGKYPQQEESVLLQLEQKRHRSTSIGQSFKRRNVERLDETLLVSSVSANSSLSEQDSRAGSGGDHNGSTILARKDMVLGLSEDGSQCKEITGSKELDSGLEVGEASTECSIPKASHILFYELKREYRTINTHRSALFSTLAPIDGFPIG